MVDEIPSRYHVISNNKIIFESVLLLVFWKDFQCSNNPSVAGEKKMRIILFVNNKIPESFEQLQEGIVREGFHQMVEECARHAQEDGSGDGGLPKSGSQIPKYRLMNHISPDFETSRVQGPYS